MHDFGRLHARRSRTKTEILERSEVDFCTPRNQQVADRGANRFWNAGAMCAKVCARRKITTSAHKKGFFKETEYSQVSIISRAHSCRSSSAHTFSGPLASIRSTGHTTFTHAATLSVSRTGVLSCPLSLSRLSFLSGLFYRSAFCRSAWAC
jgi:hypothetical protein